MKNLYLLLAITEVIVPLFFIYQFVPTEGFSISQFFANAYVNGASSIMSSDVMLTTVIFWIFMFHQSKISNAPKPYLFILLSVLVGLGSAVPAYLYSCEKKRTKL
ncbi:MAG: DUF2834 domain-containing protein [Thiohalomonadales bacterium]